MVNSKHQTILVHIYCISISWFLTFDLIKAVFIYFATWGSGRGCKYNINILSPRGVDSIQL